MKALWGLSCACAIALGSSVVLAQVPGDEVRIETGAGVVQGTLIDKLPDGYLVRINGVNRITLYAEVRSIQKIGPPAQPQVVGPPAQPQVVGPPAQPPSGRRVVIVNEPPKPPPQGGFYAPTAEPRVRYVPRNIELSGWGKILLWLGGMTALGGAIVLPVGLTLRANGTCHSPDGELSFQCVRGSGPSIVNVGAGLLTAGGITLLAGIIMNRVGGSLQEVRDDARAPLKMPSVALGPTGASLTWSF